MALTDIPGAISTAFAALPGTRLALLSNYTTGAQSVPEGEVRYQVRALSIGTRTENSNDSRSLLQVGITCAYGLTQSGGLYLEALYTDGQMLTDSRTLMGRSFWVAISGVHQLNEIEIEVERIGSVMIYTATAELVVDF